MFKETIKKIIMIIIIISTGIASIYFGQKNQEIFTGPDIFSEFSPVEIELMEKCERGETLTNLEFYSLTNPDGLLNKRLKAIEDFNKAKKLKDYSQGKFLECLKNAEDEKKEEVKIFPKIFKEIKQLWWDPENSDNLYLEVE